MEDLSLTETELRYFGDLFLCCDVDKTGKIPVLKATELFRSANLSNDVIRQITLLCGIPQTALHVSRSQFYSCLKLIAAYQASVPLRVEILSSSTINLPLPRFSWKDSPPPLNRGNSGSHLIPANVAAIASTSNFTSSSLIASASGNVTTNETNGLISTMAAHSGSTNVTSSSTLLSSHHPSHSNPHAHHHHHHHHHNHRDSNTNRREWREVKSPDLIQLSTNNTSDVPQDVNNSDLQSTDSEVEPNELNTGRGNRRTRGEGSPEAWSTNSDSPTPTNSVAERPWVKENIWQGILGGDEHRQLLGTEEESSDRHSSDEDNETDLEPLYQITSEQREYYHKQFKAVQPDPNGLLSGHVARVFFEKSRIPIEELRHIWQLCDVTRDGALSLAEFTAAMHLVVLRRNNIPLPSVLPPCLHPTVLSQQQQQVVLHHHQVDPPEADLLHLGDDDDKTDSPASIPQPPPSLPHTSTITNITTTSSNAKSIIKDNSSDYKRMISVAHHHSDNKNIMNLSSLSNTSQVNVSSKSQHMKVSSSPITSGGSHQNKNRSVSNSPPPPSSTVGGGITEPTTPPNQRVKELSKDWSNLNREWTKFTESPTSNVSSPGPKPVNFDMQRTAQAVVSDPQILHPVPLRVTPVGAEATEDENLNRLNRRSETLVYDSSTGILRENESSPKQQQSHHQQQPQQQQHQQNSHHSSSTSSSSSQHQHQQQQQQQQHRESLQGSDLRPIQRPQPKKLPTKSIGAIPPPPQREPSFGNSSSSGGAVGGSGTVINNNDVVEVLPHGVNNLLLTKKTEVPPLPPPRPHRHARSSSLDLNKLKMSGTPSQAEHITTQNSFEVQMDSTNSGFADFTHFPADANKSVPSEQLTTSYIGNVDHHYNQSTTTTTAATTAATTGQQHIQPPATTVRPVIPSQRVSAFEVYRKPNATPRNSQSPPEQQQQQQLQLPSTVVQQHQPSSVNSLSTGSISSSGGGGGGGIGNTTDYDRRITGLTETFRHVSFKQDKNILDVLRHLREQNILLLRLCNDLSEELLTVQQKKEEIRSKIESGGTGSSNSGIMDNSGIHSNV